MPREQIVALISRAIREGSVVGIAPCLPRETGDLPPEVASRSLGPLVDDTLGVCQDCGREIWVGPRKLAAFRQGRAVLVCYACSSTWLRLGRAPGQPVPMLDLNPDRVELPRRVPPR